MADNTNQDPLATQHIPEMIDPAHDSAGVEENPQEYDDSVLADEEYDGPYEAGKSQEAEAKDGNAPDEALKEDSATPQQSHPRPITLEERVDVFINTVQHHIQEVVSTMKDDQEKSFQLGLNLGTTIATDIEESFNPKQVHPMNGEPIIFAIHLQGITGLRVGVFHKDSMKIQSFEDPSKEYDFSQIVYWSPTTNSLHAYRTFAKQQIALEEAQHRKEAEEENGGVPVLQGQL